jgi:hypothetical protein
MTGQRQQQEINMKENTDRELTPLFDLHADEEAQALSADIPPHVTIKKVADAAMEKVVKNKVMVKVVVMAEAYAGGRAWAWGTGPTG